MSNAINWFELPTTDLNRAIDFYNQVLDADLQTMEMGPTIMAFFPSTEQGVGGALVYGDGNKPSAEGTLAYLNGGDDLETRLSRVEAAGGKVLTPKTSIGENGFIGIFMDTEGNRVAFHSMK